MEDQYGGTLCEACEAGDCTHCTPMWWDSIRRRMFVCTHGCRFQKRKQEDLREKIGSGEKNDENPNKKKDET